jgi:hypothetical protein
MKLIKTIINIGNRRNRILLHNNYNYCGEISFINKNNTTILSNLYVPSFHRNNGYATEILKEVEMSAINDYFKNYPKNNKLLEYEFKLCAWESLYKPYLVSFYKKRGYSIDLNQKTNYYDNQDEIFELVKMTKKIKLN